MASPIIIQILPATLTELTIIVESTNGIEVKTLADCDITAFAITLTLPRPPYSSVNLKFYSQGYSIAILENVSVGQRIELTPTSDYIKTSDGTNDYYVKDTYSRQFENDLLDIVMTKANSSDIPAAITESTVSDWGFTKNTGTVTSVNNVSPVSGNVALAIPTAISDLLDDTRIIPIDKAKSVVDNNTGSLKFWTGTKNEYDELGNNYYAWKFNASTIYTKSLLLTNMTKIYDSNGNATSQKCSSFYGWSFQSAQVYTQATNPQIGDYIAYGGGTTFSLSTDEITSVTPTTITVGNLTYTRDISLDTIQSDTVGYISVTGTTSVYEKYTRDTSLDFTLGDTQYNNDIIYICTDIGDIYKGTTSLLSSRIATNDIWYNDTSSTLYIGVSQS